MVGYSLPSSQGTNVRCITYLLFHLITLAQTIQLNHTMPPVGIFKCPHVADNNEDQPPAEERVLTENHEWDTPTRVRVKVLFDDRVPRREIEKQTKVPVRSQQRISKGPDRRPGKNRPGAPHKLSKRDIRMMVRHLSRSREKQPIYVAAARARLRLGMSP